MSGEHHIHFSSVTAGTGAENVPPIGRGVSRVIFGLFHCHSSFSNASVLFKKEFTSMSVMSHSWIRDITFFGGLFGFACMLVWFYILDNSNFNAQQDLCFLPILCSVLVDLTVADWLTVRLLRTLKQFLHSHTQAEPPYNLTLAVSNIPQAAMEDSWFR